MPGCANLACIYLAAGDGRRFGRGKLEAELNGTMLGLHAAATLAALGFGQMVAVCNAANQSLNRALAALGFEIAINPDPASGQASSLALGIGQITDAKIAGAAIALADMPFITAGHVEHLTAASNGNRTACSTDGETRMPPAIFPRQSFPELLRLTGDRGARALLNGAIAIAAPPGTLSDIDSQSDLQRVIG